MRKGKLIYQIGIDKRGKFVERPNRFVADIKLENDNIVTCHVHDSGRIRELLFKDNSIGIKKPKKEALEKLNGM
ncbi:putative DNA-binding transcriptional regulator [Fusobacterium varium]|nr:hypothetical protein [Fusobacterium varium]VEH38669.1 putative DNA-binding transcriptional regulator [Fusobacterium varium]